jgi:hypothetical protein
LIRASCLRTFFALRQRSAAQLPPHREREAAMDDAATVRTLPTLAVSGSWSWEVALQGAARGALAAAMAGAIGTRRWFGAKTRSIQSLEVIDAIAFSARVRLLLARIHFSRGAAEVYQVPLAFADGETAARLLANDADVWMRVESTDGGRLGVLYDALGEAGFCRQLLALFESSATLRGAAAH